MPNSGHIQATGVDGAGRRQYLYHPLWRERRDRLKHDRVPEFAARLPELRSAVTEAMATRGLNRDRVLATGIRLLDLGFFRIGDLQYARANGTYGLVSLKRHHVSFHRGEAEFEYAAKDSLLRTERIHDPAANAVPGTPRPCAGPPTSTAG